MGNIFDSSGMLNTSGGGFGGFMAGLGNGFVNGMSGNATPESSLLPGPTGTDPLIQLWNNMTGKTQQQIQQDANFNANAWATPVSAPQVNGVSNYTTQFGQAVAPPNI
jgi:hypothetical protein